MLMAAFAWLRNARDVTAEEVGQTLLEYTLIIGVVVVMLWGALFLTGLGDAVVGAIDALINIFETDTLPVQP